MSHNQAVGGLTRRFLAELARLLDGVPLEAVQRAVALLLEAQAAGRRVYVIGNGGSAATASHLACDLNKSTLMPGLLPLRVQALADNVPLLTAWANDTTFERVFAEQVAGLVEPDDVVIAISASGRSPNILAGLEAAAARGARTIGLLGFDGGQALALVDHPLHVPSDDYGLVEAAHLALGQAITAEIREALRTRANGQATRGPALTFS
jgi:D-sedoheptulose 7-phosphate isomerase